MQYLPDPGAGRAGVAEAARPRPWISGPAGEAAIDGEDGQPVGIGPGLLDDGTAAIAADPAEGEVGDAAGSGAELEAGGPARHEDDEVERVSGDVDEEVVGTSGREREGPVRGDAEVGPFDADGNGADAREPGDIDEGRHGPAGMDDEEAVAGCAHGPGCGGGTVAPAIGGEARGAGNG